MITLGRRVRAFVVALAALGAGAVCACNGTTGSDLVTFDAAASGPADAVAGQPLVFDTPAGYHVTLTRARIHVGAMYLNRTVPLSGQQETSCVLPGIYVAQALWGIDVDALSPSPQPFLEPGDGTADRALTGEVWLTGGDVNADDDPTPILDVAGTATKGAASFVFDGKITIGANRKKPPSGAARPGADPICKERIVTPIPVDLTPRNGGRLLLRIDPRGLFANVPFEALPPVDGEPGVFRFQDTSTAPDDASNALYMALHFQSGVYSFEWEGGR